LAFLTTSPVSCGDTGFLKSKNQVLALRSGHKVSSLSLKPSCPLQAILLVDLFRCGSPLQIVMAVWQAFLKFEVHQTAIIVCNRLPQVAKQVKFFKKVRQMAVVTACMAA
jgi:hypothetical protein